MPGFFPYFRMQPANAVLAVTAATVLSTLAAVLPAHRSSKLDVVTALRRVG